jgi:hypothetical protein
MTSLNSGKVAALDVSHGGGMKLQAAGRSMCALLKIDTPVREN